MKLKDIVVGESYALGTGWSRYRVRVLEVGEYNASKRSWKTEMRKGAKVAYINDKGKPLNREDAWVGPRELSMLWSDYLAEKKQKDEEAKASRLAVAEEEERFEKLVDQVNERTGLNLCPSYSPYSLRRTQVHLNESHLRRILRMIEPR